LTDPTQLSAIDLARRIASRQISCIAVMEAFLDRIDAINPSVNAIVSRVERSALLAQAAEHDRIDPRTTARPALRGERCGGGRRPAPDDGLAAVA
jgi:Asp-tRNA(Asn)/Glu-tRNA(Gln) amidotransferase A subunit family amidase